MESMSYVPVTISPTTPPRIAQFIRNPVDLYLRDVHAMLRLPLTSEGIDAACNFAIAGTLLTIISGSSVVFFGAASSRTSRGKLFTTAVKRFYPWDTEPSGCINDPDIGAEHFYASFRNPLTHSFGYEPSRTMAVRINRFIGPGLTEDTLEYIERSEDRPDHVFCNVPTLIRRYHNAARMHSVDLL